MRLLRRGVKRVLRPFLRPFSYALFRRVDARIAAAVAPQQAILDTHNHAINTALAEVRKNKEGLEALRDYVPTVLNTISSQNAVARMAQRNQERLDQRIAEVGNRVESVRGELLYELRYGSRHGVLQDEPPRVLDPAKLAGSPRRLNLGSASGVRDGYINVDSREHPGVDVVAHARRLPFGDGEVDEIYSAHLLEHFPMAELRRSLLPYWYGLLRPGGAFVAVVPDHEAMIRDYAAGACTFEDLRLVTFGGQEYDGDFHFNMFTPDLLVGVLQELGFVEAHARETARRHGAGYEMEVAATKPLSGPAPAD